MILRNFYTGLLHSRLSYFPIVAILGPRQVGKTTIAQQMGAQYYFDLENPQDEISLKTPEFALKNKSGLIVIDEVQRMPDLFPFLRYWVDNHSEQKFLLLGSASIELINKSSESLAGRISYIDIAGFNWSEVNLKTDLDKLWQRGGYPRSFLAPDDLSSLQWRIDYIRTFLERDIPQLGIRLPANELRRFWTILANSNSQLLNYAELGRNFGLSEVAVRRYVEVLESALVIRSLKPWHENIGKRQVKKPKVFMRDSGLLHALLNISDIKSHPSLGASWESFVIENIISILSQSHPLLREDNFYFWRSHQGEEVDLFFELNGKRFGIEVKFNLRPKISLSMTNSVSHLKLNHLIVINPLGVTQELASKISMMSVEYFHENFRKILKLN
jgi:predicted AAA+ superfamily ATPase